VRGQGKGGSVSEERDELRRAIDEALARIDKQRDALHGSARTDERDEPEEPDSETPDE
jgi:hypothetical protein